jgi:Cu-Zn family superoxide dismutase
MQIRWTLILMLLPSLALIAAGCASAGGSGAARAAAELRDASGQVVGRAELGEVGGGVRVVVEVRDLPAGGKGVHIHETGSCEAPGFESAGGHFNPEGRQHGVQNPSGPHAGDLPNLEVGEDGTGRLEVTTDRVSLGAGQSSLFDADGSAIVVHAGPDDLRTDPAGNSGDRIACGLIEKTRDRSRQAGY